MIKATSDTGNWVIVDNIRGIAAGVGGDTANDQLLFPNGTFAESTQAAIELNPTGFRVKSNSNIANGGTTYAYVAIRRPHKPASEFAATELFHVESSDFYNSIKGNNFPADMALFHQTGASNNNRITTRLTDTGVLFPDSTGAESSESYYSWDNQQGMEAIYSLNLGNWGWKIFRRAPGFFDVVTYTGTGSVATVNHNLGAVPELMIIKGRDITQHWAVYNGDLPGSGKFLSLNNNWDGTNTNSTFWNGTDPTATNFTLGASNNYVNGTASNYIAYLFATVPGISKVGTYTGTGSDVDVDCGFSAGARFVMVKRTDSTGDWYVWDTARGIVAGNEPYVLINTYSTDVTGTDYIDPLSSGFTITSGAPAALNASGGSYLFLAIA
jgi:hypothetical protein